MYRKQINPAFEIKKNGKRGKLIGYLGQLFDDKTMIHDKEYSSYHQAEVALDALLYDLLSRTPEPASEPATTCVFCSKPHNPQTCPEMRAMLFSSAPLDVDFAPVGPEAA